MPAQKHDTRKNYIGLLTNEAEESRATTIANATDQARMSDYVRDLMAAMLKRGSKPR
ncbi:hypothetical protein JQ604_01140 [Bradyrhizobium jicamae]|uniref:hypothetical protein n=1 Tax=Bradyrhizobium jicamae TaxID=280332 RepID=UPI001BAA6B83|nr:hypothetical protein [Bradyrhizobium jicamae]MBR0750783.1 hypothetical protein [Bradyrhizobium jicamae]